MVSVPLTKPEDVTPQWLTRVLRNNDVLTTGEAVDVKIKLTKTLVVSVVSRLEITYSADAPATAPRQLFLKLSKPNISTSTFPDLNRPEVDFYINVGPEMTDPPFIQCFDAVYSADSDASHLLMEDLSDTHFQPKAGDLPAAELCRMAIEAFARLHAYWWDDARLGKEIGNLFDEAALSAFVGNVEGSVAAFVDSMGDRLSPERRKIFDRLVAARREIWGRLTDSKGLTVTHGDAHWWNILYPRDQQDDKARLFDWQLWHVDLGARDIAFLIALGGFADRPITMDEELLQLYHRLLVENGVKNYSWKKFWDDYRWSAIRNLNVAVIQWTSGRGESVWLPTLERAMESYDELGCSDLIGK